MPNGLAGSAQVSYPLWAPDGTAAAPSYSFAAAHGTGHYRVGGALMSSVAGSWIGGFSLDLGSLMLSSTLSLGWSSGHQTTPDLTLYRDAANVLAQRNGVNAQEFRVYGTTTGPKYLSLAHNGTNGIIGTDGILYLSAGSGSITLTGGFATLLWSADNTYDIGASGATRPRYVWVGSAVIAPAFQFNSLGYIQAASDGVWFMTNSTTTDFGRLCFGGTTSAFPAWKRVSSYFQARLADDSGFTAVCGTAFLDANTTQVVSTQGAAVADATGAGDIVAQFNTLLSRLRSGTGHGLIAT